MLSGFVLGCLGLFGFVFAVLTYPNGGLLVALAPFCLSMLIATTAIGAGAIVEAVNRHRKASLENTERLIQVLERLKPVESQSPDAASQSPASYPLSTEAINARWAEGQARREPRI